MPKFRYRAIAQSGEVVSGVITASTSAEVARRIDYLRLVPIDAIVQDGSARQSNFSLKFEKRGRPEDITIFTLDLALLLKAGARLDRALELLATDGDIGHLHSTVGAIRSSVLTGESFADALTHHPALFPPMYVALVRVGEASGTLENVLQVLARDRGRAEELRRRVADALRYPMFLLFAAACVLTFFLMFVLPQFGSILHDFGAKIDPIAGAFLAISEFLNANKELIAVLVAIILAAGMLLVRQQRFRTSVSVILMQLPLVRTVARLHQTALFCRNLEVLLAAGVALTTALQIIANMMESWGRGATWMGVTERVRQGGKLSDALEESENLPIMAVRILRLGEETGQLSVLAGRVADFYETKLQRSLDRIVGLVGPLAIIVISAFVGGLITSVMTALLSVSQSVG